MLALVAIFLATILMSSVTVWFYRAVAGWQGFRHVVVGRQNANTQMSLKTQSGFIAMLTDSKQKAKSVRLLSPKGGIKAPWGW